MKTVKWIKTGEMIQSSAKYLTSEEMTTGYVSNHPMLKDKATKEWFHLYEYDPATDHSFQRELNFAKGLKVETT